MRFKYLLVLPLLAASLQAASVDDLTFTLNGAGTEYSVTDCDITASDFLDIPSTYNGLPVTSIGYRAFLESGLTNITIPDSVTSIAAGAFQACTSLSSITIPNSVTWIRNHAFQDCTSLTSITIPDSVTSIGNYAFFNCSSLTSITIPDSVTSIGTDVFYECTSLTSITLPYKFAGTTSLYGIPQNNAEITVNFNDVSEGLLANTNFLAGISHEVIFDSSALDQAIADEAQARADADVLLQANIDNYFTQEAGREDLRIYVDSAVASMQSYVDSAVAQGILGLQGERGEKGDKGDPGDTGPQGPPGLDSEAIQTLKVSEPHVVANEDGTFNVQYTVQSSDDLSTWTDEEIINRTITPEGTDKQFLRIGVD